MGRSLAARAATHCRGEIVGGVVVHRGTGLVPGVAPLGISSLCFSGSIWIGGRPATRGFRGIAFSKKHRYVARRHKPEG